MTMKQEVWVLFHYFKLFLSWKTGILSRSIIPEDLSIELSNQCNFLCKFCVHSDESYQKTFQYHEISIDQLDLIFQRIRSAGIKTKVIHFNLGGEPFLYPNCNKAFSTAYQHGFRNIIFSSNGSLLSNEAYQSLFYKDDLYYDVWIDFCADAQYFETVRGFPGSWALIKNNVMEILCQSNNPHLKLHMTDITSFQHNDKEYLKHQFEKLKQLFQSLDHISFHQRVFHNATGFLKSNKAVSKNRKICPHPWASLVIAANGDIVSCSRDITHKTVLGNLLNDDLLKIIKSTNYQNFRKQHRRKDLSQISACKDCDLPFDKNKMNVKHYMNTFLYRLGAKSKRAK